MDTLELNAEPREITGRHVKYLRKQGIVPVILYGQDFESIPLQVKEGELEKVLRVAGTHQLISLKVGQESPRITMARDIQQDVIRRDYLHVDFYAVKMDRKVTAQIPIELVGVAPAVAEFGGVLTQGLDELEIECLPGDLINSIEVSVDGLGELNDLIIVSELDLSDKITILSDPESVIAKVEPPRLIAEDEEEEELEEAPISAEPEVLTGAKREEDDEE